MLIYSLRIYINTDFQMYCKRKYGILQTLLLLELVVPQILLQMSEIIKVIIENSQSFTVIERKWILSERFFPLGFSRRSLVYIYDPYTLNFIFQKDFVNVYRHWNSNNQDIRKKKQCYPDSTVLYFTSHMFTMCLSDLIHNWKLK